MTIAQQLYEGIDIGSEGTVGLITYMRTDSVRISEIARKEANDYIAGRFGKEYSAEKRSTKAAQVPRKLMKLSDRRQFIATLKK
jgi:DNA topoisomerase I